MSNDEAKCGVSSCYVFKSRLQEYAQKVGLCPPRYETIKEGPSHEPFFRSTAILNNARYDSLPGFSNRKAAEQSAAEVALIQLAKSSDDNKDCISLPVHELGLCKNLLQEYAQKMNYAMPTYECKKEEGTGRGHFSCSVDIGGIRYIGAVASTKKEAEIKAGRTALLAIQTSSIETGDDVDDGTNLTVVPPKRKELPPKKVKTRKTKTGRFNKRFVNKRRKVNEDSASATATATQPNNISTEVNEDTTSATATQPNNISTVETLKTNQSLQDECPPVSSMHMPQEAC